MNIVYKYLHLLFNIYEKHIGSKLLQMSRLLDNFTEQRRLTISVHAEAYWINIVLHTPCFCFEGQVDNLSVLYV